MTGALRRLLLTAAVCLTLLWTPPAHGQPTVEVEVIVVDQLGDPVPGAGVRLIGRGGTFPPGVTGYDGTVRFRVPSGTYDVRAELAGFSIDERRGVQVGPAASSQVVVMLGGFPEGEITVASQSGTTDRPGQAPTWNAWAELRDARRPEPLDRLEVNGVYDLSLDLAPFAHRHPGVVSAEADETLAQELWRLYQDRTKADLYVVPLLVGNVLELDGDAVSTWRNGRWEPADDDGMVAMEIRLAQLFEAAERTPRTAANWKADSDRARAGGIRLPVRAVRAGCAAVAYSIWDPSRSKPLDHVLHTVAVGEAECDGGGGSRPLGSGLRGLLRTPDQEELRAALHLFEIAPDRGRDAHTLAVYVPRQPFAGCSSFAWQRRGEISDFFSQSGFTGLLKRARRDSDQDVYAALAKQVRHLVFPPVVPPTADGEPRCDGWEALQALKALASEPGQSLYVKLVDVHYRNLLVPIGLLFSLTEGQPGELRRAFEHAPTVRQPLPVESLESADRCIGSWRVVLPEKLSDSSDSFELPALPDGLGNFTSGDDFTVGRSFDDLLDALAGEYGEPDPEEPGTGLVVLAHQANGALYFRDPSKVDGSDVEVWRADELGDYRFPYGSVALLSVCSAGDLSQSAGVVRVLNEAGFDAIIVSPFEVPTHFGIALAYAFAAVAAEHVEQGRKSTVLGLFEAALATVVADLEPQLKWRAHGLATEFLLAGNGDLRLCGQEDD